MSTNCQPRDNFMALFYNDAHTANLSHAIYISVVYSTPNESMNQVLVLDPISEYLPKLPMVLSSTWICIFY